MRLPFFFLKTMDIWITDHTVLRAALYLGVGAFLLSILILGASLVIQRHQRQRRSSRASYLNAWQSLLAAKQPVERLSEEPFEIDYPAVTIEAWVESAQAAGTERVSRLREFARHSKLDQVCADLLHSADLTHRLAALTALAEMEASNSWNDVVTRLEADSYFEALVAARTLLKMQPDRAAPMIASLLAERPERTTVFVHEFAQQLLPRERERVREAAREAGHSTETLGLRPAAVTPPTLR